jgi:hypothetical protein
MESSVSIHSLGFKLHFVSYSLAPPVILVCPWKKFSGGDRGENKLFVGQVKFTDVETGTCRHYYPRGSAFEPFGFLDEHVHVRPVSCQYRA